MNTYNWRADCHCPAATQLVDGSRGHLFKAMTMGGIFNVSQTHLFCERCGVVIHLISPTTESALESAEALEQIPETAEVAA